MFIPRKGASAAGLAATASSPSASPPSLSRSGGAANVAEQFLQTGSTVNDSTSNNATSGRQTRRVHHRRLSSSREGDELHASGVYLGNSATSVSAAGRGGGDLTPSGASTAMVNGGVTIIGASSSPTKSVAAPSSLSPNNNNRINSGDGGGGKYTSTRSPRVSLLLLFALLLVVCLLLFGGSSDGGAMTSLSGGTLRVSRFLFENGLFSAGSSDPNADGDKARSEKSTAEEQLPEDIDDVRWLLGNEGILAPTEGGRRARGGVGAGGASSRRDLQKRTQSKHLSETQEETMLRLRKRYWAADTEEEGETEDGDERTTPPPAPKLHRYSITACAHSFTLSNVPADLIDTHPFYKARVQCYCLEPPQIYAAAGQVGVVARGNEGSETTTDAAIPPNGSGDDHSPAANSTTAAVASRLSWLPPIPPPNRRTCLLRVRSALIFKKKKQSSKRKSKKDGGSIGGGSAFTQPNEIMIGSPDPSIGFFFRIDVEDPKIDRQVFLRSTWGGGVVKSEASPHGIAAGDPIANFPISMNLRVNGAPTLFLPSAIFQMNFYHSVVGPHGVMQLESTRGAINRFYAEGRGPDIADGTDGTGGGNEEPGIGGLLEATRSNLAAAGAPSPPAAQPSGVGNAPLPNPYPPLRHVFEPLPTPTLSSAASGTDSSTSSFTSPSPFPFLFPPASDPDAHNGANRPDPRPILDTAEIGKLDYRWHMARCSTYDYHKLALPVAVAGEPSGNSGNSVGEVGRSGSGGDKGGNGGASKTAIHDGGGRSSPPPSSSPSPSLSPPLAYLAPEVIVGDNTYLHFKPIVPTLEWFGRGRVNGHLAGGGGGGSSLSWVNHGGKTSSNSNNVSSSPPPSPYHTRLGFCQQQLTKEAGALVATEDLWIGALSGQIGANWATSKGYRQLGAVSRAEGLKGAVAAAGDQQPLAVSGGGNDSPNQQESAVLHSALLRPASLLPPTPFTRPAPMSPSLNDTVTLEEYATICPMSRWELKAHRYGLAQMKRVLDEELRRATSYTTTTTVVAEASTTNANANTNADYSDSTGRVVPSPPLPVAPSPPMPAAVQRFAGYDSNNPPPCHVKPISTAHRGGKGGDGASPSTSTICPLVVGRGVSRDVQRTRGIPKGLEFSIMDALLMPLPSSPPTESSAAGAHDESEEAVAQLQALNTKASGGLPACALGEQKERPFLYQGLTFAEETSIMVPSPAAGSVGGGGSSSSTSTSSSFSSSVVPLYSPSQLVRRRFDELSIVEQYGLVQSADLFIVEEGAPGVWAFLMGGRTASKEGGEGRAGEAQKQKRKQRSAALRLQLRRRRVTVVLVFGHNYERSLRMNDEFVKDDRIVAVPRSDPIEVLIATEFFMTSPFITRGVRVLLFTYQQGRMPSFAKLREAYDRPWRPETVIVGCEGNTTRFASYRDLEPLC